ncbi:MAG: GHKL domain-containing protein [Bacilli bacterium]
MIDFLSDVVIILFQTIACTSILLKILGINKNGNLKRIIMSFIVVGLVIVLSYYFIPNHLRFLTTIVTMIIISYFILRESMANTLVSCFFSAILMALTEIILTSILFSAGLKQDVLINNKTWNLMFNILISVGSLITINIKPILNCILKLKEMTIKRKNFFYGFLIMLVVLYLIVAKNALFASVTLDVFINLLILFISTLLFTMIFVSDNKNRQLQIMNKQTMSYVEKYEKIITEQGKANHEFKNQLMVIKGYAQLKSDKLLDYINSIVEDVKKTSSNYLISQLNNFPDGGLKGLLYYKLSIMEDEKISYEIYVEKGVKSKLASININLYKDITKIVGVLLDNAIEASKKTKLKKIIVDVSLEKSMIILTVSNSYNGQIELDKIGSGYTTKGLGRGFGLRLVDDILSKNQGLTYEKAITTDLYSSKLFIKVRKTRKTK